MQAGGDLLFRNAGADLLQNIRQRPLRDALGGHHGLYLLIILHHPQVPQELRCGHQVTGQGLAVALVVLNGHVGILKAHPAELLVPDDLLNEGGIAPPMADLPKLGALHIPGGSFRVPGVGKVVGPFPGHQGHAVGPGGVKAGAVKTVGLTGQQNGVQPIAVQAGGDFLKMVH